VSGDTVNSGVEKDIVAENRIEKRKAYMKESHEGGKKTLGCGLLIVLMIVWTIFSIMLMPLGMLGVGTFIIGVIIFVVLGIGILSKGKAEKQYDKEKQEIWEKIGGKE
jgi:hypothetical protein